MFLGPMRPSFAVAAVVLLTTPLAAQEAAAPALTVHAIWATREFASDLASLQWTADGAAYTTVDEDSAGNSDLYRVDAVSGKKELLVRGADLVPPGARKPIAIEEYRFSADGARLLIFTNTVRVWRLNTKGTYYVWDLVAKRIAFWRFNQSPIPPFYLINADSLYPELVPVRYPKAGMPNSEVKIGVVDVATRAKAWVDLGPDKESYVAAMDFAGSPDEIWL